MRLIDADELKTSWENVLSKLPAGSRTAPIIQAMINDLAKEPTILPSRPDGQICCKECKWMEIIYDMDDCTNYAWCAAWGNETDQDNWCCYAAKKVKASDHAEATRQPIGTDCHWQ